MATGAFAIFTPTLTGFSLSAAGGITAFSSAFGVVVIGAGATPGLAVGSGLSFTVLTGGFFVGVGVLTAVLAALVPLSVVNNAQDRARDARDLIYKPFQSARPRMGRAPGRPEVPESGALVQVRQALADWRAAPFGRANFQQIVDQALVFRGVVSREVTRTDCR